MKTLLIAIAGSLGLNACSPAANSDKASSTVAPPPNIIVILADDIGYGDLACYGAKGIQTPNCDRLAHEGLRFTDAHATASVCTPTRYSLLTGRYAWRKPGTGILPGDAGLIIETNRATLPSILQKAGYTTAAVGKWHLGLGTGRTDFNSDIKPGPREVGFDYSFLLPATGDRVPCVYIENGRVVNLDPADPIAVNYKNKIGNEPTGTENPELLRYGTDDTLHKGTIVNSISRIGWMSGGKAALWKDEEFPDLFTSRAISFIETNRARPFFLYFATHDIHEPKVPNARFKGSSEIGTHGDVVQQFDWQVGQILAALDRLNLRSNTLVIVSSDNGGIGGGHYGYPDKEKAGDHRSSGAWRAGKGSLYEGGHREPFLARWPGHIPAGQTNDALIALVDLSATTAALTGQTLGESDAPDSFNVLPALLGTQGAQPRDHLVLQNNDQRPLALRLGQWKLVEKDLPKNAAPNTKPVLELYNLATDPRETNNLAATHPMKLAELTARLEQVRAAKRSR